MLDIWMYKPMQNGLLFVSGLNWGMQFISFYFKGHHNKIKWKKGILRKVIIKEFQNIHFRKSMPIQKKNKR